MAKAHACGPEHHADFFADFKKLMDKYPELENQYHITCVDHQTEILGIDFKKQIGVKRIEENRIIEEFRDRPPLPRLCCAWDKNNNCTSVWT